MNSLLEIPEYLHNRLRDELPGNMREKAQKILGVSYAPYQKRMKSKRIDLFEIEKMCKALGAQITISISDIDFTSNDQIIDKDQRVRDLEKITALQDEVIRLRDKVDQMREEMEELKSDSN